MLWPSDSIAELGGRLERVLPARTALWETAKILLYELLNNVTIRQSFDQEERDWDRLFSIGVSPYTASLED